MVYGRPGIDWFQRSLISQQNCVQVVLIVVCCVGSLFLMAFRPVDDRGVFQGYDDDSDLLHLRNNDGGSPATLDPNYFPPLQPVQLPVPNEKYPQSSMGPEYDDDDDGESRGLAQGAGPGSPTSVFDEPVGGLPPPNEHVFDNEVDMAAFRVAVEDAGVKQFFQKICADILLQRPDDVFRFTATKLRAEARSAHSRRVVEEKRADDLRSERLNKDALLEQERKIEGMLCCFVVAMVLFEMLFVDILLLLCDKVNAEPLNKSSFALDLFVEGKQLS